MRIREEDIVSDPPKRKLRTADPLVALERAKSLLVAKRTVLLKAQNKLLQIDEAIEAVDKRLIVAYEARLASVKGKQIPLL